MANEQNRAQVIERERGDDFDFDTGEVAAIQHVSISAIGALAKSETEAQLEAAHRFPRSITRFLREAMALVTYDQEVAESCIYSLPRSGKAITGPSVRLAEIAASCYGNLHVGARVMDAEDKEVNAQGVAWDLEKNLRVTVENRRRITGRDGKRFNDDMITMTGNAAASIALRNAIFRVIPRSYINKLYEAARKSAVGDATTLVAKRDTLIARLLKLGITLDRVLARIGKAGVEDIGLDDIATLIGYGTAIKDGDATIDQMFPAVGAAGAPPAPAAAADDGRKISLRPETTAEAKTDPTREDKPAEDAPPAEDDAAKQERDRAMKAAEQKLAEQGQSNAPGPGDLFHKGDGRGKKK